MYQHTGMTQVMARVEAVYDGQRAIHVGIGEIFFQMEGKRAIAHAAEKVGEAIGINPQDIVGHLFDNMYYIEPIRTLVLVVMLPEHELEMFAEVPARMWGFRKADGYVH